MRIAWIVPVALALMHGRAAEVKQAAEPAVSVCIDSGIGLAEKQLAQMVVGRIFHQIGTRIEWRCSSGSAQPIMITLSANPRDGSHPGALAYAQPFVGGIVVFYDRLQSFQPEMRAHVLAHVLAHEITHVLQGIDRHSESGIMKAHWDPRDLREMSSKGLVFTPYDVLLIHQGMAARRLAGPVLARVN
jgi:Zn-dependent protease with chaperone function